MRYKRINKPTARKMYYNGIKIKLLPCNVSEVALNEDTTFWVKPVEISLFTSNYSENKFDREVNSYIYYNANNQELGYYAHYYVSEEEYDKYLMCNQMCS